MLDPNPEVEGSSTADLVRVLDVYSKIVHPELSLGALRVLRDKALAAPPRDEQIATVRNVRRRVGSEAVADIVQAYRDGVPSTQLAVQHGISPSAVRDLLRNEGVALRQQPLSSDVVGEALAAYVAGKSVAAVARSLDVPAETLRRALITAGCVMRSRGRPIA